MEYKPNENTLRKLAIIDRLQKEASNRGIELYHCGSWAVSAMLGDFYRDIKDIDFVVSTESDKAIISEILKGWGYTFVAEHPWGPVEYENDLVSIEFGSAEDKRNGYYNCKLNKNNKGDLNGVTLFIADPKIMLKSRHDMIEQGIKPNDETQQFIIKTIEQFIETH
jgi:hypothetical protein